MVRGSRIRALHVSKGPEPVTKNKCTLFYSLVGALRPAGGGGVAGGGSAVAAKGKTLLGPCLFGSLDARRNAMAPGIFLGRETWRR